MTIYKIMLFYIYKQIINNQLSLYFPFYLLFLLTDALCTRFLFNLCPHLVHFIPISSSISNLFQHSLHVN